MGNVGTDKKSKSHGESTRQIETCIEGEESYRGDRFSEFQLPLVIKETLCLHNAFPILFPRECREEFVIDGYTIPAKTNILFNVAAIARDPDYWHDAESYNPERFEKSSVDFKGTNFEFIPFGAGRRMCPGMAFGLSSIEHIIAHLLYLFDWKLLNGMNHVALDISETFGATVRTKNDLCLVATLYSPL